MKAQQPICFLQPCQYGVLFFVSVEIDGCTVVGDLGKGKVNYFLFFLSGLLTWFSVVPYY